MRLLLEDRGWPVVVFVYSAAHLLQETGPRFQQYLLSLINPVDDDVHGNVQRRRQQEKQEPKVDHLKISMMVVIAVLQR